MSVGYLTDTPYTWGYYGELSPLFLNYVCALNGHHPVPLEDGFTYCDLGCGNGVTANALAQIFPQGQFTAIDFSAQHIENGAGIAQEAGLDNVDFIDRDFNDLKNSDLPEFDFIVLHGVYSWIDPETRNNVREFIADKLKPDGIAYVSYDCMPGWGFVSPIRDLMLSYTAGMLEDPATKARAALDFLHFLKDKKAAFFQDNPMASDLLEELESQDINYVIHEFFVEFSKPYYFQQVAAELRSAGLTFSGSAILNLNFVDLAAPAEFHDMLRKCTTRGQLESQGDFVRNQRFRKDVFINSRKEMDEEEQFAALSKMNFGLTCDADGFNRTLNFGDVELKFTADVFLNLIENLATGAKSVEDLKDLDQFKNYGPELLVDAVKFLSTGGQLLPFAHQTAAADEKALSAERYTLAVPFNLQMLKRRLFDQSAVTLASTKGGVAYEVAMADALFALCSVEAPRDEVAGWVFQRLIEARKQMIFEEGSELDAIAAAVDKFRAARLPKFLELGILEPA